MTEQEFEERIEVGADKFDKHITKVWDENKRFQRSIKAISFVIEGGLILKGLEEAKRGNKAIALCCIGLGATGILFEITRGFIFGKE